MVEEQRYLQVLGENLQLIMKRLMANQNLVRYLYYTDKDPLATSKPDVTSEQIYEKQIKIIPVISGMDNSKSIITLRVLKGVPIQDNSEFMNIFFNIEVFVPMTQWILKSDNLRPYLIMGEISKSLKGKKINGLGQISAPSFSTTFFTEEMSAFEMTFYMTQYD